MQRQNTSVCSLNKRVERYSKAVRSRDSLLRQRVGLYLTHSILIWEISSEQPISLTGQTISNGMRLTARHCLTLRTRLTKRWLSSITYSSYWVVRWKRYTNMHRLIRLSLRVTFLSVLIAMAVTYGQNHVTSILTVRQVLHLMTSQWMVRTGVSLLTTGMRWLRTVVSGG